MKEIFLSFLLAALSCGTLLADSAPIPISSTKFGALRESFRKADNAPAFGFDALVGWRAGRCFFGDEPDRPVASILWAQYEDKTNRSDGPLPLSDIQPPEKYAGVMNADKNYRPDVFDDGVDSSAEKAIRDTIDGQITLHAILRDSQVTHGRPAHLGKIDSAVVPTQTGNEWVITSEFFCKENPRAPRSGEIPRIEVV